MRKWWIALVVAIGLVLVSNRLAGASGPTETLVQLFSVAVANDVQALAQTLTAIGQQLATVIGAL